MAVRAKGSLQAPLHSVPYEITNRETRGTGKAGGQDGVASQNRELILMGHRVLAWALLPQPTPAGEHSGQSCPGPPRGGLEELRLSSHYKPFEWLSSTSSSHSFPPGTFRWPRASSLPPSGAWLQPCRGTFLTCITQWRS